MITALCVRKDSIYKKLGIECYDKERDMTRWEGGNAIIAHPPCAQWGKYRQFATVDQSEKDLAVTCIDLIRKFGGVLEHPSTSKLFDKKFSNRDIPMPGFIDEWGGYTICINQHWFGHPCEKKTLLYIVGCEEKQLPEIPFSLDAIQYVISPTKTEAGNLPNGKKTLPKSRRDKTPIQLARWLIEVAELCNQNLLSLYRPKRNRLCGDATGEE
jgi:hypothetical protein